jgi:hypothetical protein
MDAFAEDWNESQFWVLSPSFLFEIEIGNDVEWGLMTDWVTVF